MALKAPAPTSAPPAEFNPLISITDDANAQPSQTLPAVEIVQFCRTGPHRQQVEKIRKTFAAVLASTGDTKAAKKAVSDDKKRLPGIMLSGTFRARGDQNLEVYSHLLCGDVDGLSAERIGVVCSQLASDPHCLMVSVSPSGAGVKFLCRTTGTAAQHGQSVAAMAKYFHDLYGLALDPACKNLERLCFAPDNASDWNSAAIPFDPLPVEPKGQRARTQASSYTAPSSGRRQIAERILGPIRSTEHGDFCECPGKHLHTTVDGDRDCKVMLDGVPTLKCFHASCAGIVEGVNHELRSQIGKAETANYKAGRTADGYLGGEQPSQTAAADSTEKKPRVLTLRSPEELLGMVFDDADIILGDRIIAQSQPVVIAGAGGTGKSRLVLQMIAAIVTGRRWLNFVTGRPDMHWLILQTENSNRRLQQDLARIKAWLGDDWARFAAQVVFHTLENDDDGFVSLDAPDNLLAIQKAIETRNFGAVVIDPLNDFIAGDPNKDADMKNSLQILSRLCRRGNPDRALVVLHHALTGKAGAVRATGHDRASFARNSKTLHAWTRGQINLAAVDAESNDRLVVACGKCSNGKEFPAFGIALNPESMIYNCDSTIDIEGWATEMGGQAAGPDLSPVVVAGVVKDLTQAIGAPKKPQLVKALRDETGCSSSGAYNAIERAERAAKIRFTKATKSYAAT